MKLIIGKLNNGVINYWKSEFIPKIGDYAIVNNRNDYDLVKIIGTVETNEKYEKFLAPGGVTKSVVAIVQRDMIRED